MAKKCPLKLKKIYSEGMREGVKGTFNKNYKKAMLEVREKFNEYQKNQGPTYINSKGSKEDFSYISKYFKRYIEGARRYLILGLDKENFNSIRNFQENASKSVEEFLKANPELIPYINKILDEEQSSVIKCITGKSPKDFDVWAIETNNYLGDLLWLERRELEKDLKPDIKSFLENKGKRRI
ncbi:MAG: hypothetical protein ACOX3T_04840 [Bdellovibrionota bacterium]